MLQYSDLTSLELCRRASKQSFKYKSIKLEVKTATRNCGLFMFDYAQLQRTINVSKIHIVAN